MKLSELEKKLNEYIENNELNTIKGQNTQSNLIQNIVMVLRALLDDYNIVRVASKGNHINIFCDEDKVLVDIIVKLKKGSKYLSWDCIQSYYIDSIEFISCIESIKNIEDVEMYIINYYKAKRERENNQINDVITFMNEHNITLDEMEEYFRLYNKYKWDIRKKLKGDD